MEDFIYENHEFYLEQLFIGNTAITDALRAAFYGDYTFTDGYVKFNGCGNLESFNVSEVKEYIDIEELTDFLMENGDENNLFNDDEKDRLIESFIAYYNEKTGKTLEDFDGLGYDYIISDWDDIIEELSELENEDE